jgi:nickel-dependent lactate racemase
MDSANTLSNQQVTEILSKGLSEINLNNKKVLVIIPDSTRSGPMPLVFDCFCEHLLPRAKTLDFLIALGTHQPMSKEAIQRYLGGGGKDIHEKFPSVNVLNHRWDLNGTFKQVGAISADKVEQISRGLLEREVLVSINKLIFDYDHIIIYSPVFPHEVAGFSGGYKYFFPGIAGREIIDFTHWLGALITSYEIIGEKNTPVREAINYAASMIDVPVTGVCTVIQGTTDILGMFVGKMDNVWEKAADLSGQTHIKWLDKPCNLAVSVMPKIYDDLWTASKGMYKVEPVIADGGEVIIYAPHISEVSYTHGEAIDKIGYHVRDYFLKQWDVFKNYSGCALAHSTHLKGQGTYENGAEKPRIKVTISSQIPEIQCEKLSLGYMDPHKIDLENYTGKENEGVLLIRRAGETLYKLKQTM